MDAPQPPQIIDRTGQQWGNYRIVSSLEHGYFSKAYLGRHIQDNSKQFVIDIWPIQLTAEQVDSFMQQTGRLLQLVHPHILRMVDAGVERFVPFVVVDYVSHVPLRQLFRKGEQQPLQKLLPYLKQVTSGLQYAHDLGMLHKNIRPEHILLAGNMVPMLSEFAIDVLQQNEQFKNYQDARYPIDSIIYTAPEQIQHQAVKASDQYALAIMVYEWLCGEPPFHGTRYDVANQHIHATPTRLRYKIPAIPQEVEDVVMTALAKDPTRRFQSVTAFVNALEQTYDPRAGRAPSFMATITPEAAQAQAQARAAASTIPDPPVPVRENTPLPPVVPTVQAQVPVAADAQAYAYAAQQRPAPPPVVAALPTPPPVQPVPNTPRPSAPPAPRRNTGSTTRRAFFVSVAGVAVLAGGGSWLLYRQLHPTAPIIPGQATPNPDDGGITPTSSGPVVIVHGHTSRVNAVAWSPDGKRVASVGDDKLVMISDSTNGKTLLTYTGHKARVNAVAWSPNGKFIASGSSDKTVQVWEATTGKLVRTYKGHRGAVNAVDWAKDSTLVASGSDDRTVHAWSARTGNVLLFYREHTNSVTSVAWSPDKTMIASGSWDKTVHVCATVNSDAFAIGDKVFLYGGHSAEVYSVAWSPDGNLLASAGGDNVVQVCSGIDGSSAKYPPRRHDKPVRSVAWSHNGQFLVSGSDDKTVRVWSAQNGENSFSFTQHTDSVLAVAWSPDSKTVASAGADRTVRIWQPN